MDLIKLPAELLKLICHCLPIPDLLVFRLLCQELDIIGAEVLAERCTRLYHHEKRIHHAIEVCNHPKLSRHIGEIVIIGKSLTSMHNPNDQTVDRHLNNHPWPHSIRGNLLPVLKLRSLIEGTPFREAYKPLLEALGMLAKLNTITYSAGPSKPGFCPMSLATIDAHADAYMDWKTSFGHPGQPPISFARTVNRWSDVEFLCGLLMFSSRPFVRLNLEQPLPCCEYPNWPFLNGVYGIIRYTNRATLFKASSFAQIARNIAKCSIVIPGTDPYGDFASTLVGYMPALKHLVFYLDTEVDQDWLAQISGKPRAYVINAVANDRLARMIADPNKATGLATFKVIGRSHHPDSIEADPIIKILRNHKRSLKICELVNVFITPLHHGRSMKEGMKAILGVMQNEASLISAKLSLPRLGCDVACDYGSSGKHVRRCWHYRMAGPPWDPWFTVDTFDELANELGVHLREDGWWDFGKSPIAMR